MSRTIQFQRLRASSGAPRSEAINVGIVVWPESGKPIVKVDLSPSRLRAIHPNLGRMDFTSWVDKVIAHLERSESFQVQQAILGYAIHPFSADLECGIATVGQGESISTVADLLFDKLVALPSPTIAPSKRSKPAKLELEIRQWLRRAKLYSSKQEDLSRRRVVSQYPVDAASDLYVDFALKNGKVHVIETLDLRGLSRLTSSVRGDAAVKGITLDEAKERHEIGRRIAVVQADDYAIAKPAINLLGRYADELWDMNSSTDKQSFAEFISSTLQVQGLIAPI